MAHDHSTFVVNEGITDGMVVVVNEGHIMWAGAVQFTPLELIPAGAELHVHPALLERIRAGAERREPGGVGSVDGVR